MNEQGNQHIVGSPENFTVLNCEEDLVVTTRPWGMLGDARIIEVISKEQKFDDICVAVDEAAP